MIEVIIKFCIAVLLGGLIGFEREHFKKAAGLRTNILICLGSCSATILSINASRLFGVAQTTPADPTRIAAGILTGIGFLGAGAIMKSQAGVKGLTTAATIWVVAILGMLIGAGYYVESILLTTLTTFVLYGIGKIEKYYETRKRIVTVLLKTSDLDESDRFVEMLKELGCRDMTVRKKSDGVMVSATLRIDEETLKDLRRRLSSIEQKSILEFSYHL